MSNFDFIKDENLRNTLDDAIEFIYVLFKRSKEEGQKELYKEETHRIIILYVVSAIEAVLLYFYKDRGERIKHPEYKFVQALSPKFGHSEKKGCPLVIAVQEKKEKDQIGMRDLVTFFKAKKLIEEKMANDILELNDVRNTFHLSKPRAKSCDVKQVEAALQLLVHTIENAPKALEKK
ncbi:MAG: hypothetical protein WC843_06110 [Candidatus Gracilibacteria bacterium]|jgi:hypothetical protein